MKTNIILFLCVLATFAFTNCNEKKNDSVLKVAATAIPHAEILEQIKSDLALEGIQLEIVVVDDYQIPNRVLADGEVDANFFQHNPFLEAQVNQFGYPLRCFANIHLEPMALYSRKIKDISNLHHRASVSIPSDPANQARALLLLEKMALIRLNRHDIGATLLDISDNPKQLYFLEIDAPLLAPTLDDVDLAAINTNFALQAGLSPMKDALAIESNDSLFVNILAIRNGDEEKTPLKHLKALLMSEKVGLFIEKQYRGAIIKAQ